jgi:hypothetical protein
MANTRNQILRMGTKILQRTKGLLICFALLILTCMPNTPVSALTITLGGDFANPVPLPGLGGPLAIGGMRNTGVLEVPLHPGAPLPDHHLQFRVISHNFGGTSGDLILTDLRYRSDLLGPLVQTIRIQESYDLLAPIPPAGTASHGFAGEATFNANVPPPNPRQSARIDKVSTHEATPLLGLNDSASSVAPTVPPAPPAPPLPQLFPLTAGPTAPVAVPIIGATWDIDTTYTLTLTGGGPSLLPVIGWVQIRLPSSGEDRWAAEGTELPPSSVPEPSTLLLLGSGLAGLAVWRGRKV